MSNLENSFSLHSDRYALARPHYPEALFTWIQQQTADHDAAWDCATGNGQAAIDLAKHYRHVNACDISAEQLAQNLGAANIAYTQAPAETTPYAAQSFDLITVAQALHWFDYAKFWQEVRRVAKPQALFCAWGYSWFECDAMVQEELVLPVRELIAPFWAPNNRRLWDGYRDEDIQFPFEHIATPKLAIQEQWHVAQICQYMQTWSAYKKAAQDTVRAEKLEQLCAHAIERFEDRGSFDISMPLALIAGRV